jgi:adenylate cyclase
MSLHTYLPQDRLRALIHNESLPDRATGSVLFADISGFTALTEVLHNALGPRRGMEELTWWMESVYSTLIGEIERHGGSVISFAGDSMLCWFDEAGSGEREMGYERASASALAVACGLSLQRAIQAHAKMMLPDKSTFALTLKVAIASGTARRFVIGESNIQYIDVLAGATVACTAAAEHLVQKGDVAIDEATANRLDNRLTIKEWHSDPNSGERFAIVAALTKSVETPIISSLDVEDLASEDLHPWLHHSLFEREQTGQGSFLTEFRPCTILFIRFPGIDFDSDKAESQLNRFIQEAQQTAAHHGGTLLDLTIGDKGSYIYVNFGALGAHEDDTRRAVSTALELREAAQELGFLEPLQIGVTQGTLRVGAYGGQTRKTFGALGDEVNLAARLMMTAAAGEILVSSRVYKAVEPYFVFEPRPPLRMKGKAEPLPVFAVTGKRKQRAIRLQEPNYALPMVGRSTELELIEEKLDLTCSGKAQIIGITAEPGLGKSRLVAEVIRLAHKRGFVGYGGACQSDGIHTPYLAWKSIWSAFFDVEPAAPLKKQIRLLEGEIEDRAPNRLQAMPLLNVVLDMTISENEFTSNLEPQYRKTALTALLEDCLRAASEEEPLLIVIEDVHWIDALSHGLLDDLAKMLVNCSICFVLAYRPPQITRLQAPRLEALPHFTKIELHELTRPEAEQAIRAKLAQLYPARSGAVPPQLVDKLMQRAQGNPFFLEELLNYLHDRGLDPRDPMDLEKIELPDSLHTLVLSRIDQLSEHEKTTLRVASIVGRLFRAAWLTGYYPALGDLPRVKMDLDKLDSMDITPLESQPELAYLFKHIVTHEVTYESLPFSLRAQLHEQLADYLEGQITKGIMHESALLDTLVFHYTHSDNKVKQRAYLRKAAYVALNTSGFNTAVAYLTQLLELTPEMDPTRSILALQLAEAYWRLGDYSTARTMIGQAQAAAKDDTDHVAALAMLAELSSETGNYIEAQKILAQAVPMAQASNDPLTLCKALYTLAGNYIDLGKLDDAEVIINESLALARALGDVTRELFILTSLGLLKSRQVRLDEAERLFQEVYTRASEVGNRERAMAVLNNLGVVADERGDYVAGRDYYRQALPLAYEIGSQRGAALFLINLAEANIQLNELSAGRSGLREGLTRARQLGALPLVVSAMIAFALLAHAEGQTERALALLGLARQHPAWQHGHQRTLHLFLTKWALDPSVVEEGLAKGTELDWNKTIEELLKE